MKGLAAAVGMLLIASPAAIARVRTVAPPGNSGVSQYLETIPTAKGGRPSGTIHLGGGGGPGPLSPAIVRAFAQTGPAGRSAAALADATAPVSGPGEPAGHRSGPRSSSLSSSASTGAGASAAGSLAKALTGSSGSGGLGLLLPAILVLLVIGGGVIARLGRRSPA